MARKQILIPGGLRKSVNIPDAATVGTTLAGYAGQTLTIAQLQTLLGVTAPLPNTQIPTGGSTTIINNAARKQAQAAGMFVSGGDDDGGGGSGPPGRRGKDGAAGSMGPAGPAGTPGGPRGFPIALVREPAEPPSPILVRGPRGLTGAMGAQGPAGRTKIWLPEEAPEPTMFVGRAKASAAGSSLPAVPAGVPNLVLWIDASILTEAAASTLSILPVANPTRVPNFPQYIGTGGTTAPGAKVAASLLNGRPYIDLTNNNASIAFLSTWSVGLAQQCTFFAVTNPLAITGGDHIGGNSNAMNIQTTSARKLTVTQSNVAVKATSTGAMTASTWQQINVTWNNATAAYAFRIARASAGSGTASAFSSVAAGSNAIFYNGQVVSNFYGGYYAEMLCYNRVLSGTEISAVEAYLLAKWGV